MAHKLANQDREIASQQNSHENEICKLKTKIKLLEEDKTKALKEKEKLLDEVCCDKSLNGI
jgi:hypothetical protein